MNGSTHVTKSRAILITDAESSTNGQREVCHLLDSLEVGGMEQMLCELAIEQKKRGWRVHVGCLLRRGPLEARLISAGIDVECFDKKVGIDLKAILRIRSWLNRYEFAVIHTHNAVSHYYCAAALVGKRRRVSVNTRHDMGLHNKSARLSALYKLSLKKTNLVAAVCEAAKIQFVSTGEIPTGQCLVIPNGVDVSKFDSKFDNAVNVRDLAKLSSNSFVIGTVGRLNEVKSQYRLIDAVAALGKRGFPAKLVLVGKGPEKERLEQRAATLQILDSVVFLGERDDVSRFLWSFDVFALPSKTEGYSMALVEASAAGVAIVASDVGGNRDIITPNISGILYPQENETLLVDALQSLMTQSTLKSSLSAAARRWANQNGATSAMYLRYTQAYGVLADPQK
jgi:glycosyltransferase involved in cell wall biosynthesis